MISNITIKRVQSLKHKKYRQKYNLFVAEGEKITSILLQQEHYIVRSIYSYDKLKFKDQRQEPPFFKTTKSELDRLSHMKSAAEVVVEVEIPSHNPPSYTPYFKCIYLDDVQDPGNVGTIIRIADWYGIDAVIRSPGSADFYGNKVIQSTMGSFVNVDLWTMDAPTLRSIKDIQLIASALVDQKPKPLLDKTKAKCLIIGNEGQGVSPELVAHADSICRIDGSPSRIAESLNAAVAAGILCDRIFG